MRSSGWSMNIILTILLTSSDDSESLYKTKCKISVILHCMYTTCTVVAENYKRIEGHSNIISHMYMYMYILFCIIINKIV